jgi:abortive infection bacteriophage resistance protein
MNNRTPFKKPPTTPAQQVALLCSRGMIVSDIAQAESFLTKVNYYRFCGYALHFEVMQNGIRTHQYKPDVRFEDVCMLYEFDSELRTILFSSIEHIEVAFRTAICLEMALATKDSHWYLQPGLFNTSFNHQQLLDDAQSEFDRSREVFILSYKQKYCAPALPPAWMLTEILPLGKWSKIYSGLKFRDNQKGIARQLNTSYFHLQSWMHGISFLRNLCAHHSRIWNKTFPILVNLTERHKQSVLYHDRLAGFCTVMADLLTTLGRKGEFKRQMGDLFKKYPGVPIAKLGFKEQWDEGATWK